MTVLTSVSATSGLGVVDGESKQLIPSAIGETGTTVGVIFVQHCPRHCAHLSAAQTTTARARSLRAGFHCDVTSQIRLAAPRVIRVVGMPRSTPLQTAPEKRGISATAGNVCANPLPAYVRRMKETPVACRQPAKPTASEASCAGIRDADAAD